MRCLQLLYQRIGCEKPLSVVWDAKCLLNVNEKQSYKEILYRAAFFDYCTGIFTHILSVDGQRAKRPASNEKKINAGAFMTLTLLYREEFQLEGILLFIFLLCYSNWGKHVDISFKKVLYYSVFL